VGEEAAVADERKTKNQGKIVVRVEEAGPLQGGGWMPSSKLTVDCAAAVGGRRFSIIGQSLQQIYQVGWFFF